MQQLEEQATDAQQSAASGGLKHQPLPPDYADKLFYRFHHHTISDSTESNDSSPTTTVSTVDDSSATEPSPGSSPESPPPSTFTADMPRPRTSDDANGAFFELQKQPPPRKGRNLKNLAVDTSRHTARAASTTSLPLQPSNLDAATSIASPAFVKPPSPPKRKASNLGLTLLTPANNRAIPEVKLAIPPTPALRTGALRHFQSSPSLPVLPGLGLQTDIPLPSYRPTALETIFSPLEPSQQGPLAQEDEQNFDIPLSQEVKPEAYPEGPISVYPPYVDLYLEPTVEQCRQYDVILNVASEVRNPLAEIVEPTAQEPDIRIDGGGGIQYAPKRPEMNTEDRFRIAIEPSPTTPKATPLNATFPAEVKGSEEPEYIHIPWEHNSDIVPDLLRLCKLIDEKVQHKQRVLVHCQCGVSRSASLVVAYGLYKNPTMSVQEAYDAVKTRSKWIGPNMNLIMQLQEFRTSLSRGGLLPSNRGLTPITPSSALSEWRGPFSAHPSDPSSLHAPLSASAAEATQGPSQLSPVAPGPSSAPSSLRWPVSEQVPPVPAARNRAASAVKRTSAYVDPSGHLVPVLKVVDAEPKEASVRTTHIALPEATYEDNDQATPTEPLASPRSTEFAMTPLHPPSEADPADDFGLMSPSSTEFASSPFDRSALLASLGMGSMHPGNPPRRTISLRSRTRPKREDSAALGLMPGSERKLRGKISSPSIREQQQLQHMQAQIEARLSLNQPSPTAGFGVVDDALLSPRATEFTHNPFAMTLSEPPTTAPKDETPSSPIADPRSPAQTGVSPITRNILDVL